MKELKESDLEIGDILIFEDFDFDKNLLREKIFKKNKKGEIEYTKNLNAVFYYLLDYLIAWFDPGKEGEDYRNIYHAGIWGNVDINRDNDLPSSYENCIIEAGTNGIGYATLEDTLKHEAVMNVYVCRLKEKTTSFEIEINNSIKNFYREKGKYSFKTAWLLAVICSLRYTKGILHKILVKKFYFKSIADFIVKKILESINEYNNHNQRDMIACSPLVAMMYKNAGYELSVLVFQALNNIELPEPNFDLKDLGNLEEKSPMTSNHNEDKEWPAIKETVVTPRQLMESPDVETIGVLRHQNK